MRRHSWHLALAAALLAPACGANVEQEREALLAADREWSASAKNIDQFMSHVAPDASMYPPGMPVTTGADAIRKMFTEMSSAPGFSVQWTPTKAEVSSDGMLGHTAGTYELQTAGTTERGKYFTAWKKIGGAWRVTDDIFNASEGQPGAAHTMVKAADLKWGDPPPALPAGAKLAVVAGDPSKAGPFAIRLQFPAGYKVAAHWHPTDEHVTVLSGTIAVGMGDAFDAAKLTEMPAGAYAAIPARMNHFAQAKTAATIQVAGNGPFVLNYVNPADDPGKGVK